MHCCRYCEKSSEIAHIKICNCDNVHIRCRETIKKIMPKTPEFYCCDKCHQNYNDVSLVKDQEICCRYCHLKNDDNSIKICECDPVHQECRLIDKKYNKNFVCGRCDEVYQDRLVAHNNYRIYAMKRDILWIFVSICILAIIALALIFATYYSPIFFIFISMFVIIIIIFSICLLIKVHWIFKLNKANKQLESNLVVIGLQVV